MTQSQLEHVDDERQAERLTEQVADWRGAEIVIDEAARLIRNVALAGLASRNGYRYSEQALRSAVALYDNKPVFLDHAANLARPLERSTRDLVGTIVEPRFHEGRIRGDIHVVDTEAGRTFLALAASNAPSVGMSHVVLVRKNAPGDVVEQIQEVVSVDAVVFPATTTSLRENRQDVDDDASISSPTDERAARTNEIESRRQETLDEIVSCWPGVRRLLDQTQDISAVVPSTSATVATDEEISRLLSRSGLPDFAVTETFRQCLLGTADPAMRRQLCIDRMRLIEETRRLHPSSRERIAPSRPNDEQVILATLRRRPTTVLAGYG